MSTRRFIATLATAGLLVTAGCGEDDADEATPSASPSEAVTTMAEPTDDESTPLDADTTSPAASPTETASPSEEADDADKSDDDVDVQVDSSSNVGIAETSLGTILVDGDGMTLYIFDSDGQGASTCSGQCASNWPPLTVDGDPVAGESVDETLLGTTDRDDGVKQVTYDGWPLYQWAQDAAPGDVNGHGVSGAWWVIGPDGTPIRK